MLIISPILYEELARMLLEALNGKTFYSDKLLIETPEIDYIFEATLLIHYCEEHYPEGSEDQIAKIIPVWWEFHTSDDDGELVNDFDFNLLTRLICR